MRTCTACNAEGPSFESLTRPPIKGVAIDVKSLRLGKLAFSRSGEDCPNEPRGRLGSNPRFTLLKWKRIGETFVQALGDRPTAHPQAWFGVDLEAPRVHVRVCKLRALLRAGAATQEVPSWNLTSATKAAGGLWQAGLSLSVCNMGKTNTRHLHRFTRWHQVLSRKSPRHRLLKILQWEVR